MVSRGARNWFRIGLVWTAVVGGYLVIVTLLLPALAESGYGGTVLKENAAQNRDASALFYTESDRTWEILRELRGE